MARVGQATLVWLTSEGLTKEEIQQCIRLQKDQRIPWREAIDTVKDGRTK